MERLFQVRRFDPGRAFATPRAVKALIGPCPCVIADDFWAKLLWAGLNLEGGDLHALGGIGGSTPTGLASPHVLEKALAVTWLFAGLRIAPTTLAKAYADARYFARNVRTIEVLIDRVAVQSGAAAAGEAWQYYDLGHGYCTYNFFEQCPHRMACARCDFYLPKGATKAQLLEAKDNLQRMLVGVPLTDDERAAVEDGTDALDRLLERLADVPTPAGPTPHPLTGKSLPSIRATRSDGERHPLPDRVDAAFDQVVEASVALLIDGPHLALVCHFFTPNETELDLDPRAIDGEQRLDRLLTFLRTLARLLRKEVILTPENLPDHPWFRIDPGGGSEEWLADDPAPDDVARTRRESRERG